MTNLKWIRTQKGLTQKQLAEKSGVSLKMIQKYEAGEKNINHARAITVWRLAVALKDCPASFLFEYTAEWKNALDYLNEHREGVNKNDI